MTKSERVLWNMKKTLVHDIQFGSMEDILKAAQMLAVIVEQEMEVPENEEE